VSCYLVGIYSAAVIDLQLLKGFLAVYRGLRVNLDSLRFKLREFFLFIIKINI
jgi:hypothetical protein